MLTGTISTSADLAERDYRRTFPRYQEGNLEHNAALLATLRGIATEGGMTMAQLCLAWLLARSPRTVPIVGTKRRKWVDENAAAAEIRLDEATLQAVDRAFDASAVAGERYRPSAMARLAGTAADAGRE
jgi:aryl-alcohol dehydrogenase-like predicted oxidoreductase